MEACDMRMPCVNITAKMKEMAEATKRTVLIVIKSIAVDMYKIYDPSATHSTTGSLLIRG
jgi:endonuclease V-like protein UPF0215 family